MCRRMESLQKSYSVTSTYISKVNIVNSRQTVPAD